MTMTIVVHWWHTPVIMIGLGIILAVLWPDERFDFMGWPGSEWPFAKTLTVITLLLVGLGWFIGGWMAS